MEAASASEPVDARAGTDVLPGSEAPAAGPAAASPERAAQATVRERRLPVWWRRIRFAVAVYLGTRLLLLAVALVDRSFQHQVFLDELSNWDGMWFRALAHHGYPTHVSHAQTTLGFFPLFPMLMWVVAHAFGDPSIRGLSLAGVAVSGVGGLVATVLVQELATGWWGRAAGRRATALFCLFPGSVVFSMVYAESLLLPLAAGCLLALERRRWLLAGVLAGVATAVQPDALALVPVCLVSAVLALRRDGWRVARQSLAAPLLSVTGAAAFAGFLWAWTGTPFANLLAQHYGWGETTDGLALVHQASWLADQISFSHFNNPTINLNLPVGLIGAGVLLAGLILLARLPRGNRISAEALVWTLAISFLCVTSEFVPPNPRLLITAFPAVLVFAARLRGRAAVALLVGNGALLVGLSYLTFVGTTLRP